MPDVSGPYGRHFQPWPEKACPVSTALTDTAPALGAMVKVIPGLMQDVPAPSDVAAGLVCHGVGCGGADGILRVLGGVWETPAPPRR